MLELAILGLLKEHPMHGYELRKQLAQKLGYFWTVSFGSLYPTLKKLERRGVVEKRPSTDESSRRKQVYAITASGENEFLDLLAENAESAWEEEKFPLRVAFFRYLGPEARMRLLERRVRYLQDKLDVGRASLKRATRRRDDSYTVSLMRHGMETTERDIAWLQGLITTERRLLESEASEASDASPAPPTSTEAGQRPPDEPDSADQLQAR